VALTPQVLLKIEDRMKVIAEREYVRLTSALWWQSVAKLRPSTGRKEVLTWLLSTAMIKDQGKGGNISFDELVALYTEYENRYAGSGFRIEKGDLDDADGGGMALAAQWSGDIGAYAAYWPQKRTADILKNGHTASLYRSYDTKAFFATDHPLNPFKPSLGSYANLFTGVASGSYPGACRIDDGVTVDVALVNLGKIFGYIAGIKMPNGEDPRFLRPRALLTPPRLFPRAVQLTSAKLLAQGATGGAATADVESLIKALGFATPTMADELSGFEDDTTFFIVCEQVSSSELGAIVYQEREAFAVNFYGILTDAELGRINQMEWQCRGRNVVGPGHPFLIFKCKAT
jgi:phage major head subunit gpT-like protein